MESSNIRVRVDVKSVNGDRLTEPQETLNGSFPATWWPAKPGETVEVMVDLRPEVLAEWPGLPRTLRVRLMAQSFAVALALLLASCGWHGSGSVVGRDHNGSRWTQSCHTYKKSGTSRRVTDCSPVYHSEQWRLLVKDAAGKRHWIDVSEHDYDAHQTGSGWEG